MSISFTDVTDVSRKCSDARQKLNALCDEWNALNESADLGDNPAGLDRLDELDRLIKSQKSRVYKLARESGIVLPGSRWAKRKAA